MLSRCLLLGCLIGGAFTELEARLPTIHHAGEYVARLATEVPIIDGRALEWVNLNAIGWSTDRQNYGLLPSDVLNENAGENVAVFQASWDERALYLAYTIYDTQITVTDNQGCFEQDDAVEFYLSLAGPNEVRHGYLTPREFQFIVNADNRLKTIRGLTNPPTGAYGHRDFNWKPGGIETAVGTQGTLNINGDIDTSLIYEISIPWSVLEFTPQVGDTLFADAAVRDKDAGRSAVIHDWAALRIFAHADHWNPFILANADGRTVKQNTELGDQKNVIGYCMASLILVALLFWAGRYARMHRRRKFSRSAATPTTTDAKVNELPDPTERTSATAPLPIDYVHSTPQARPTVDVVELIDTVKGNYQDPEDLKDLAARVGISVKKARAGIKEQTGFTYKQLIKEIRLTESARLLEQTDLSVSEIGYHVGFGDLSNFRRRFKDKFATSPSQYRKDCVREKGKQ